MEKWMVAAKRADFNQISKDFHIDPVIARLIRNRDVTGNQAIEEYLHGSLDCIHSPMELKDMEKALDILNHAIRQGSKIRIIGDYDIDGVMSTYILLCGLQRVGGIVDARIPDRITDGYGLKESLVLEAGQSGAELLLTCDNGIAAASQIRLAKELGMQVIVTDHHEVPYEENVSGRRTYLLPPADAVINPRQAGCAYPFKELCGAAVAWKVIAGLYERFGVSKSEWEDLLEYVAIATVGDVMDLKGENRILVKEGLNRLRRTKNIGLGELMRSNALHPEQINVYHIGFVLGPCLNASGRLDTAERALEMLCASDTRSATALAGDLKALNDSRKDMTLKSTQEAMRLVEESGLKDDKVLVVYLPDCHESLAGIIAGRLREQYHRPSYVITNTQNGAKGSGRSIQAYSMYEELCQCKELLTTFGGHPMAAGIALAKEDIGALRKKLNDNCRLTGDDLLEKVVIDMAMPISYVDKGLIRQMELLQPFGKGNAKPLFAQKSIWVSEVRILGKNRNVAKMRLTDGSGYTVPGVYFGNAEEFAAFAKAQPDMSIAYYPGINSYMGQETLQVTVQNYSK